MSYVTFVNTYGEDDHRHLPTDRYHSVRAGWRSWIKPSSAFLFRRGLRRHARYRSTGDLGQLNRALRDLSEAVWGRARFLGDVDGGRRHWAEYANNFGIALWDAFQRTGKVDHLDNAVEWLRLSSEALEGDSAVRAQVLANTVTVVEARSALPRQNKELPDITQLRRELSTSSAAPVRERLAAARFCGYSAAESTGPASGLDDLETAVKLLPQAAWWGHGRETREWLLADYTGLATDTAACAVTAGEPVRALEALEGGRAVMWTQLLKTRTDRTALREVAPLLAKRMDRVAAKLERDDSLPADKRMILVRRWDRLEKRANRRLRLRQEWEALLERAQEALPSGTFTMPVFTEHLRPAADEGPVVVVNVSRFGCHALIVERGAQEPRVVDLPDLSYDDVHDHAKQYAIGDYVPGGQESVIAEILDWLWRTVASPVLNAIDHELATTESGEKVWPRVWWCPTGPLAMLPLHAAAAHQREDSADAAVLDQVVPSYAPTLRILVQARKSRDTEHASGDTADRQLLYVAPGESPGQEGLPGADQTRTHLETLISANRRAVLEGLAATRESVQKKLAQHVWAHFDCHGVQDMDSPFETGLVLHDGTLTVADLAGVRRDRAEFAFLAACLTAAGSDRLPDEAITLATALKYAGYQAVIGTLSSVPDRSSARITRSVYDELALDGELQPSESARALHKAVREERLRRPDHPSGWAPFVHIGL